MEYEMSKDSHPQNEILGQILMNSGLPEIFGISQNPDKEGLQILAGFLKEAAEGNIGDPKDLPVWKKIGKHCLDQQ